MASPAPQRRALLGNPKPSPRTGNAGFALPVAEEAKPVFPQRSKSRRISVSPNGFSGTARWTGGAKRRMRSPCHPEEAKPTKDLADFHIATYTSAALRLRRRGGYQPPALTSPVQGQVSPPIRREALTEGSYSLSHGSRPPQQFPLRGRQRAFSLRRRWHPPISREVDAG